MQMLQQMQGLVGVLVVVVIAVLYARRALCRTRGKRPTTNGNVFEVMNEVFSPARHTSALELRTRQRQGPVSPVPDDLLPPTPDVRYVHAKRKGVPASTDLASSGAPGTSDTLRRVAREGCGEASGSTG